MTPRAAALSTILALELLEVTGPSNQVINVNPAAIVDLRVPRVAEHFAAGVNCLVFTSDGKHLAVAQKCDAIKAQLKTFDGHRP